jgi:hypothetical protein
MDGELVNESLRKMIALESVRIGCAVSRAGEFEEDPGTAEYTLTIVGDDCHRQGDLDDSELVDHVRAILGEPAESIHFRGQEYVRDPRTGDWLSEDVERTRRGRAVIESRVLAVGRSDTEPAWSDLEARRLLLLFGSLIDPVLPFSVVEESMADGQEIVRLRSESAGSIPFSGLPSKGHFDERIRAGLPPELREQIESMMDRIPDSFHHVTELCVDRTTMLVDRYERTDESLLDRRVVHRVRTTHVFSQFNEAQLPGPLPE